MLPGVIGTIQATEAIKLMLGAGTHAGRPAAALRRLEHELPRAEAAARSGVPGLRRPSDRPRADRLRAVLRHRAAGRRARAPADAGRLRRSTVQDLKRADRLRRSRRYLLDVREPHEFQISRIPGSTLIPLGQVGSRRRGDQPRPQAGADRRPLQDGRPQRQGGRAAARSRASNAPRTSRAASSPGSIRSIRSCRSTEVGPTREIGGSGDSGVRKKLLFVPSAFCLHGPYLSPEGRSLERRCFQEKTMRIAFQGAPGAYSEMAAQRAWPGVETVPVRAVRGRVRRGGRGTDVARPAADRELDRRQHPPQLRPAARARSADRRRDRAAGGPLSGRRCRAPSCRRSAACARIRRRWRSASSSCAGCPTSRSSPPTTPPAAPELIRDQKLTDTAAIASARAAEIFGLAVLQAGIQDYRDNITRFLLDRARPAGARHRRQDLAGVRPAERARRAVQGAERVRAARHRYDQARVAARCAAGPGSICSTSIWRRGGPTSGAAGRLIHLAESARWVKTLGSYARWNEASMKTLHRRGARGRLGGVSRLPFPFCLTPLTRGSSALRRKNPLLNAEQLDFEDQRRILPDGSGDCPPIRKPAPAAARTGADRRPACPPPRGSIRRSHRCRRA